jgi:DNA-binding response OmpR family regulator
MSSAQATPQANRWTVLVIEDSQTQAMHLQALLAREELEVTLAFDGQSGLTMAHQLHPDIIILDVQMPDMNGFQVCEALACANDMADVSIIMLTCRDDQEAVMQGLAAGAVDYIPKDAFSDAVLLETLRQMGVIA